GKGTTARLRLHASRFQIIPATGGFGGRGMEPSLAARVLLVGDDPRLVAVLSGLLPGEGPARTTATNGDRGVRIFDPAPHDVVSTDPGMPRTTGGEVAERVKQKAPDTAVFLLTGWGESVSAHESSQFVDRVIAKPVSAESLLEQLAELKRPRPPSA